MQTSPIITHVCTFWDNTQYCNQTRAYEGLELNSLFESWNYGALHYTAMLFSVDTSGVTSYRSNQSIIPHSWSQNPALYMQNSAWYATWGTAPGMPVPPDNLTWTWYGESVSGLDSGNVAVCIHNDSVQCGTMIVNPEPSVLAMLAPIFVAAYLLMLRRRHK